VPSHPSVPRGPARVRASDADRERVAVAIREHWHAGRLTDEELEQRLGRVFAARTFGDLRRLVGDLPIPPAAARATAKRAPESVWRELLRWVQRAVVAVATVFAILVAIAIIDDDDRERGSREDASSSRSDRPPPPATPETTRVRAGATGVDDDLAFRVRRVLPARTVPLRSDRGGGELSPGEGRKYLVADVEFTNRGGRALDPFCGSNGARLFSRDGRTHELVDDLYRLAGNETVCGGVAPGARTDVQLVFSVPPSAQARSLELWNADARDDVIGSYTRLRFAL